jgi:hypothetical protein
MRKGGIRKRIKKREQLVGNKDMRYEEYNPKSASF